MTNRLVSFLIFVRVKIYSSLPRFSVIGIVKEGFNYEEKFGVGWGRWGGVGWIESKFSVSSGPICFSLSWS